MENDGIALLVETNRWFYPSGTLVKKSKICLQVWDKGVMQVIKTFYDVTPAQAARAVALQNKLASGGKR